MFKNTFIVCLITCVLFLLVDACFGLFFPVDIKPYWSHPERISHPAYQNESYFSEEFLIESFTQPGTWITPEETILVFPGEFHGKFFNVDKIGNATYRRTLNSDSGKDAATILLLGGSTVYNSEVPDDLTIASNLSRNLQVLSNRKFKILNAGVTSVNSHQELARLKFELNNGLRPEAVIVFDGVNDILQGVYFNNPNGVMFSIAKKTKLKTFEKKIKSFLPRNIYLKIKSIKKEPERIIPAHLIDNEFFEIARETATIYYENIMAMQQLAEKYNFQLYIFLQPNIYNANFKIQTEDIDLAIKLAKKNTPRLDKVFLEGYPLLQSKVNSAQQKGVKIFDLSGIFNNKNENIFLDFCHVNSMGNKLIADTIVQHLKKENVLF